MSLVRELTQLLSRLSVEAGSAQQGAGRRRRRRRRRRRAAQRAPPRNPSGMGVSAGTQLAVPRRNRRGLGAMNGVVMNGSPASGEVVLTRSERFVDVTLASTASTEAFEKRLRPSNFDWLKTMAAAFERYRWEAVVVEYRPLVGSTTDGYIAVGMDWSSGTSLSSKSQVLAMTPVCDGPVWQGFRMPLPRDRLQNRLWYDMQQDDVDGAPGFIAWASSKPASSQKTYGEIWVHYRVRMSGTRQ